MFNKKAEMGIGTLIIFIAMILVAAIAAGVLIQTAGSLQNKALLTGERSKGQVSTNVLPIVLYAEDGTSGSSVDSFFIKAKLAPGSDPVAFDEMLVEFSLKDASADMEYATGGCASPNSTHFKADYLISGQNQRDGYLQRGDVVKICFNSTRSVEEDESVSVTLVPKIGSPTQIDSAMPAIITQKRIVVYP